MIHICKVPEGEQIIESIKITANGHDVPVHEIRVSAMPFNRRWPGHQRQLDQTEIAYYVALDADEAVNFCVMPNKVFKEAVVKPLTHGIKVDTDNKCIQFTAPQCGGYSLELDGWHNAIMILVNPIVKYHVTKNENLIYYGSGIHHVGEIILKDNQTLFIDDGAVVYANVVVQNASNVQIIGHGVLDNSESKEVILFEMEELGDGSFDVHNCTRKNAIEITLCKNITIDGITIRNSLCYNISTSDVDGFNVDNVKIIGCWRFNSDGIDMHNIRNAVVKNCFLRTYDDGICVKAFADYYPVSENVLIENCTLWNDWGVALEIGAESCAEEIRNITFRNCIVLRPCGFAIGITNVDYAYDHDICFENITVEYDAVMYRPRAQKTDEDKYSFEDKANLDHTPALIFNSLAHHFEYTVDKSRTGKIDNIHYKNIRAIGPKNPKICFKGMDSEHKISDCTLEEIYINDKKITSFDEIETDFNEYVENIIIK